jgi:hypothetical protein
MPSRIFSHLHPPCAFKFLFSFTSQESRFIFIFWEKVDLNLTLCLHHFIIYGIIAWIKDNLIEIQVLATKCEELPLNGMMLIYLSAAGSCLRLAELKCYQLSVGKHILVSTQIYNFLTSKKNIISFRWDGSLWTWPRCQRESCEQL